MIQKGQTEEKRIYLENTNVPEVADKPRKVPPPPILLCRTDTMMVFKPAPFCSEDGQEVSDLDIVSIEVVGKVIWVRGFECEVKVNELIFFLVFLNGQLS